jgi:hypothetical protein
MVSMDATKDFSRPHMAGGPFRKDIAAVPDSNPKRLHRTSPLFDGADRIDERSCFGQVR